MNHKNTKIVVGMSGGVDSSVTALVLLEQGYDVRGMFMKNWEEDDREDYCAAAQDYADAQSVCETLGIPLDTINFSYEYWERVFQDFLSEYRAGRTPNPDVLCNKEIKFKEFLDAAHRLGADFIATGHYALIDRADDGLRLLKGIDCSKDQSYFLYTLNQSALARTLFPIGHLAKSEVRKRAKSAGLAIHDKKDSTGICFIGTRNFRSFLQKYLPPKPGPIMSVDGDYLGNHDGPMYYTLGQRQGLGIGGPGDAWYVVSKNIERNALVVAQGHDHPALYHNVLEAHHLHWIADSPPKLPLRCTAKTRYRQSDQECTIEKIQHDTAVVAFDEPQRALTPGQSIVFNQDTECLGGGIISNASNSPEMDMALSAP